MPVLGKLLIPPFQIDIPLTTHKIRAVSQPVSKSAKNPPD